MLKAIVLGGSKGIGRAIAVSLSKIGCNVVATSRKQIDTSNLTSVKKFVKKHKQTDILILNTGGPPPKPFSQVTEKEWQKYHNQLFLGFCIILQRLKISDGGYVFVITSGVIKEPNPKLVISSAYRLAFTSVFKLVSKELAARQISCINIAPGLINTDRLRELGTSTDLVKNIPMKRLGEPREIGDFIKGIVENNVKYLSGITITFDGANSNFIL
ncbi:MAG TPA: SDR family NAD(P)-dependent oxidoreductase [Candidatus Nitrosotenuis sp.]|nr:SDR family NAD(P)-dependent oxidoreductase [Candidatus Nitrosotenuis sp.]HIH46586.1 SDR family NAD(P)-dependent oxidoreductase [Candidatus Nitrosotenuis sp.]HIH68817.1 SDR family NAD(P)-dependent oxidoreductase [Candidatus Nitrosotenuis sp.]HII04266.1 SDR family NAD(P)-dependent oxidoreductase [Candidatus Nitrosotenuis sp.]